MWKGGVIWLGTEPSDGLFELTVRLQKLREIY
jgi:hypothetical protein